MQRLSDLAQKTTVALTTSVFTVATGLAAFLDRMQSLLAVVALLVGILGSLLTLANQWRRFRASAPSPTPLPPRIKDPPDP